MPRRVNIHCLTYWNVRCLKKAAPDNAACEGLLGRLKNEMLYNQDWTGVKKSEFMDIPCDSRNAASQMFLIVLQLSCF